MKVLICIIGIIATAIAEDSDVAIEKVLKDGNDLFTSNLFPEVVKQHPDKSVILSAFSVLTPLGQLSLASVGASHDEILKAIGFPNDNVTKEVFSHLNTKLRSVKGIELRMANKVYIPTSYELNDKYAVVAKDVFNSEVQNIDFSKSKESADTINAWVESQTNNRIKELVSPDSLTTDTRAVLVNAIYFKGSWKEKFNKDITRDRDFHVTKEKTIKVPTMYKQASFLYGESEELDAKLLELPYEGDEASFLIVLPNKIDGLAALEEKLKDPSLLEKAIKNLQQQEVDLFLPKFKIETKTDLKQALQNIDIKKIFDSADAHLDNLLKDAKDLYVSEAIQKAFIEVNEEGAEAAAANAFYGFGSSLKINPEFVADRPFYFELRYQSNSLFNGIIVEPTTK
ncbi:alaserpin-like isoform X3 [Achroia grisella]|uniref:alaserpin-like isoform X3 n=1 Tax=Achroia grisella TaxID=688607 RepID=UPI0027D2BF0F|nr:alaserpin-like isoform X3 [Achroia grisella]